MAYSHAGSLSASAWTGAPTVVQPGLDPAVIATGAASPPPSAGRTWYQSLVQRVKRLKREVLALYFAVQDPRVGCVPQALALVAVGCAHRVTASALDLPLLMSPLRRSALHRPSAVS